MRKYMPVVVAVVAVVVVAAVLKSRPRSDPEATNANERVAQPSPTAVPDRESVAENRSAPVSAEPGEKADEAPLSDMQSSIRMKMDALQQDPDYKERPGMLFDLMLEAPLEAVHELLKISDDIHYSVGFRDDMKAAAFERLYQLEPVAALLAMDASTLSASQKNSRMEVFLEEWASRAPREVAAFLEQGQLTGVSSDLTYGALVRGSAMNGELDVVDAALTRMEDAKLRYYALKSAARVLQRDHADQFDGWLNTLPDSDQNTALAESAWMLADDNIEHALIGLDQLEERGADELPVTRQRIAVKWAEHDPVQAADWVAAQNVMGEDREVLFANVIRVWASKDRSAAVAWVDSLIENGQVDEAFMNRVAGRL